jgi:EAL domain
MALEYGSFEARGSRGLPIRPRPFGIAQCHLRRRQSLHLLVQNAWTEIARAATLVATVVSLARAFNTKTVAEGVGAAEQLQKLRYMKCDQAQGYLFSRLVPAANVPTKIARLERAQFTTIHAFSNPTDSTR